MRSFLAAMGLERLVKRVQDEVDGRTEMQKLRMKTYVCTTINTDTSYPVLAVEKDNLWCRRDM